MNEKYRNNSGRKNKNSTTEIDTGIVGEKMKVLTFDNSTSNFGKNNSKSNSFTLSDEGNSIQSKTEVKKYLKENGKKIIILTNWFSKTQIPRLERS